MIWRVLCEIGTDSRPQPQFMTYARRFVTIALLACVSLIHDSAPSHAQDRPTFSSGVALVPITAVVRDAKSRIVRDLARDDFQVLENSQPRTILDFRATDQGPITLAVLLDTSGSMQGANLAKGKVVIDRLLGAMTRTGDEAALFTFDNAIRQETPFTSDMGSIRAALTQSDGWGLTSIYDAIADTAKRLADRRVERRAVIVVTDGIDTSSTLSPTEVSNLASAIDVPVYVIAVMGTRRHADAPDGAERSELSLLAYWTGGEAHHATGADQADRTVGELMAELRQQYFLAIESSVANGWHRLDVTTKRRDLKVRTRSGYFANTVSEH